MRLSEAIRLGIGAVMERRSTYLSLTTPIPCGCAIGTGAYAIGYRGHPSDSSICGKLWPWTEEVRDGKTYIKIHQELSAMHYGGASREACADWVEQLENERGITDGQAYTEGGEASVESLCGRPTVSQGVDVA